MPSQKALLVLSCIAALSAGCAGGGSESNGPTPSDPTPTDPTPTDPAPTDPAPTDPVPTDPEPTDPSPQPVAVSIDQFYTEPTEFANETLNVVTNYDADGTDGEDDTAAFQAAVNRLSQIGGGKLEVPEGDYHVLTLNMKSNVHIEFAEGATLYPSKISDNRNYQMFRFARTPQAPIENIKISGLGDGFTVDLTQSTSENIAVFDLANISNFMLDNIKINDNRTIFANILVSFAEHDSDGDGTREPYWPKNGVVQNVRNYGAQVGYGLVQMYAADNIYFKDIHSTGGVALRMETDNLRMKEVGEGGIRDIYAENVSCENGLTAVMFSPHFMDNGTVQVNGVESKGCAFAVRIDNGFVELFSPAGQTYEQAAWVAEVEEMLGEGSVELSYRRGNGGTRWAARIKPEFADITYEKTGLRPGTYADSNVFNVHAEYAHNAQLKIEFLDYLACVDLQEVCSVDGIGREVDGAAVGAVYNNTITGSGGYTVNVHNVTRTGFMDEQHESILRDTPHVCTRTVWPPACTPQ